MKHMEYTMGNLQGATLYRQQDQSKIKFGQKKYEPVDVKTIQKQKYIH